jgi:hypothetical protein
MKRILPFLCLVPLLLGATIVIQGPTVHGTGVTTCTSADNQTFNSGTSYTPTCSGTATVKGWGAGASGGGYSCCATGGGGGAFAQKNSVTITSGSAYSFTIGTGGTSAVTGNQGVNGRRRRNGFELRYQYERQRRRKFRQRQHGRCGRRRGQYGRRRRYGRSSNERAERKQRKRARRRRIRRGGIRWERRQRRRRERADHH